MFKEKEGKKEHTTHLSTCFYVAFCGRGGIWDALGWTRRGGCYFALVKLDVSHITKYAKPHTTASVVFCK